MKRLLVALALLVLASGAARAQLFAPPIYRTLYDQALTKARLGKIAGAYDAIHGKPAAAPPAATRAPLSATDFKRDGRRPQVAAVLGTAEVDPQLAQALQEAVDMMFAAVGKEFRKDNLATAMGFAMAAAVEVAQGKDLSADEVKQIIANVNDIMVASADVKKMTAAQMQDLHDRLIMGAGFMVAFNMMKDPQARAMGQSLARDLLAQINAK